MTEDSYEEASDYIQRARSRMATLETRLRRDPAFNDTQFLYQIGEAKRYLAEAHRAGPKQTASAVSQALSEFLTIVPDELSSEHEEYYNKALSETSEALKVLPDDDRELDWNEIEEEIQEIVDYLFATGQITIAKVQDISEE